VCALHCAQLLHTILHRTDLLIFPLTLETITIAPMMSIWGKGVSVAVTVHCQSGAVVVYIIYSLCCWRCSRFICRHVWIQLLIFSVADRPTGFYTWHILKFNADIIACISEAVTAVISNRIDSYAWLEYFSQREKTLCVKRTQMTPTIIVLFVMFWLTVLHLLDDRVHFCDVSCPWWQHQNIVELLTPVNFVTE